MILLDTSGLLAVIDEGQAFHAAATASLRAASPHRLLSPFVLAELDYMLQRNLGTPAQLELVDEVARGAYQLEPFESADVASARRILKRYADLNIGLADASIVVLAERHGIHDVLTLDERHFRALRVGRKQFRLLPADA